MIANPPFSAKQWWTAIEVNRLKKTDKNGKEKEVPPNYKKELKDPFGRLGYGIPPRGYADLAFVQHMLASLKDNSRMGVVLPHGVLFRGGEEGKIRTGLLKGNSELPGNRIEAIIGLPSALFYNTGIPACVLILNKQKPENLKNKVIIIDASREFAQGKNQNSLRPEDIEHIHDAHSAAFHHNTEEDKYCRVVDMAEIEENDFNLNIARYIDTSEPEPQVDISIVLSELNTIDQRLKAVDAELDGYIAGLFPYAVLVTGRFSNMKTEDFDKAFDEGSDEIDAVVQWDRGCRPDLESKRVNIDFPVWMLKALDKEAAKLGIARQAIVKTWLAEKLEQVRH